MKKANNVSFYFFLNDNVKQCQVKEEKKVAKDKNLSHFSLSRSSNFRVSATFKSDVTAFSLLKLSYQLVIEGNYPRPCVSIRMNHIQVLLRHALVFDTIRRV